MLYEVITGFIVKRPETSPHYDAGPLDFCVCNMWNNTSESAHGMPADFHIMVTERGEELVDNKMFGNFLQHGERQRKRNNFV